MRSDEPGIDFFLTHVKRSVFQCAVPWLFFTISAFSQYTFSSIDFNGSCYGGPPLGSGSTTVIEEGRAYDVTTYGMECGYHCDQDQGRFVYTFLTGDFDIKVQIANVFNATGARHSRAGLMVRKKSLGVSDPFLSVHVTSNHNLPYSDVYAFDYRPSTGGSLYNQTFYYHVQPVELCGYETAPIHCERNFPNEWVRIQRTGTTYMAWYGHDGETWNELHRWNESFPGVGPNFIADIGDEVAVGLIVHANPEGRRDVMATGQFRSLTMPGYATETRPPRTCNQGRRTTAAAGRPAAMTYFDIQGRSLSASRPFKSGITIGKTGHETCRLAPDNRYGN